LGKKEHITGGVTSGARLSEVVIRAIPPFPQNTTPRTKTCPWGPGQRKGWGTERFCATGKNSMPEMAHAGEDHGHAEAIGGVDHVLIFN